MKHIFSILCLASLLAATNGHAQTTYPLNQVALGDGSSTLSSSSSFRCNPSSPQLSITSTYDNYISLYNMAGAGHFQFDADGHFVWWTPLNGTRKMMLTNEGQLRIGTSAVSLSSAAAPSRYSLVTSGGALFNNYVTVQHATTGSTVANNNYYTSSVSNYTLQGITAANAYHAAQENVFTVLPATAGQNDSIGGYQSAAQKNTVELNNQNYVDQGAGQVWSVQTNYFHPIASHLSKYINTYVRTQLGYSNTIGTYYSLYLEAPFGPGGTSQIGNYYGVYQESSAARNFFGGKVWIGNLPAGSPANAVDAQLAVNGNVYCSRLKVTQSGWADYVFGPGYQLPTLEQVERFIKQYKHLPGVASAKDIEEKGNDIGENQKVLLQKIEELTLYLIDLKKDVETLRQQNRVLKQTSH